MKGIKLALLVFLLFTIALLLPGCKGVVPSPGATEDDTSVTGQILMPFCCLLLDEMEDTEITNQISRYSGSECYDETDIWRPTPGALVELREVDDCKVKYSTTTDEEGNYEFTDVKPGMYILTVYCPTDTGYFLKDVIEKKAGEALDAGIPDCDSTSLAFVLEYIGDTYCHCQIICPCFQNKEWNKEYKLIEKIATSPEVNMQIDIPAILAHEDFGTLCNVDSQGNLIEDDLVDLVCSKLQGCCIGPGATTDGNGNGGDDTPALEVVKTADPTTYYEAGQVITYTITVENTGDMDLTGIVVNDDTADTGPTYVSGDTGADNILSVGETWTYTASYTITEDDLDLTSITNTADATSDEGATDDDTAEVDKLTLTCKGETAWGGDSEGSGAAWWYYFDTSGASTQAIYAGQKLTDGTVTYDNDNNGVLYINLGSAMVLDSSKDHPVKIQGYNTIPSSKPVPGQFTTYKGTSLTIENVGTGYNYYAIHLDVVVLCE